MVNAPLEKNNGQDDSEVNRFDDTDITGTASTSSSHNNVNGNGTSSSLTSLTPLQLLQSFLKAQATRAGISNELATAFEETNITDNALQKVVEISSIGLLEVMAECEAIIRELDIRSSHATTNNNVDGQGAVSLQRLKQICQNVEKLEKQRVAEETKRLQVLRIAKLNELSLGDSEEVQSSNAACMVEQRQQLAGMMAASQTAQQRIQQLVEDINDSLQDIREYVADTLPDE